MGRMARPRSPKRADDVGAAVDELFAVPLESFTSSRNELAKKLRDVGDRDAAERVASLRKPTLAAWTVNQLARRYRREVDLLLDAGHRLIEAQRGAGSADERTAPARQQRHAVDKLLAAARSLLESRTSEETIRKVAESLRAASLTEEGRESLARGRLTDAVTTTGWDILVERAGGPSAPRKQPAPRKHGRTAELERAKRALGAAQADHAEARTAAREAAQELERARHALEQVERRSYAADERLAAAAEGVADARAELDRLRRHPSS